MVPAPFRNTVSLEKYKCILVQHDETLLFVLLSSDAIPDFKIIAGDGTFRRIAGS